MLKDITLGQYFPGKSLLHKTDARVKILALIAYLVLVLSAKSAVSFAFVLSVTAIMIAISGIPLKTVLRALRPLLFILIFTAVINVFFVSGETVLFEWKFIRIYREGIENAVKMTVRLICLVGGTSVLLTYTTSPLDLTDGLERLLNPLKYIKVPVHDFAMMMSIALRFIPILMEEMDKIMKAQMARGADFESKNIVKRVKSLIPLLVPLFISAFRRANDLALAMEARCYRGGEGRSKMRPLKYEKRDIGAYLVCFLYFALIVSLGILQKFELINGIESLI